MEPADTGKSDPATASATSSASRSSHRRAARTGDATNAARPNDGSERSAIQQHYRRDHHPYMPIGGAFAIAVDLRIPSLKILIFKMPNWAEIAGLSHLSA